MVPLSSGSICLVTYIRGGGGGGERPHKHEEIREFAKLDPLSFFMLGQSVSSKPFMLGWNLQIIPPNHPKNTPQIRTLPVLGSFAVFWAGYFPPGGFRILGGGGGPFRGSSGQV